MQCNLIKCAWHAKSLFIPTQLQRIISSAIKVLRLSSVCLPNYLALSLTASNFHRPLMSLLRSKKRKLRRRLPMKLEQECANHSEKVLEAPRQTGIVCSFSAEAHGCKWHAWQAIQRFSFMKVQTCFRCSFANLHVVGSTGFLISLLWK